MRPSRTAAIVLVLAVAVVTSIVLSVGSGSPKRPPRPVAVHRSAADGLPPGSGALVANVIRPTWMRASAGGRTLGMVGPHTQFGSPDVLLVRRIDDRWLGVLSELAGNGRMGWVPRSAVSLRRDSYLVEASLSARNLVVMAAGRVLARYAARHPRVDGGESDRDPRHRGYRVDRPARQPRLPARDRGGRRLADQARARGNSGDDHRLRIFRGSWGWSFHPAVQG